MKIGVIHDIIEQCTKCKCWNAPSGNILNGRCNKNIILSSNCKEIILINDGLFRDV